MKLLAKDKAFYFINALVLGLLAIVTVYPLWYTLMFSLSSPLSVDIAGLYFVPKGGIFFDTYAKVFGTRQILSSYGNTIFVTVIGTVISMFLTVLVSYSLSKKKLKVVKYITLMIIFTMLFDGGIIPRYLVVRNLGLLNDRFAMILPIAVNAFFLLILRNFFSNIPDSIEESARIDGASIPTILFRIVMPISIPALVTVTLFYSVNYWNDFLQCLYYISDSSKQVIQLLLRNLISTGESAFMGGMEQADGEMINPESIKMATVVISILPIMCMYPFLQKYFVKGATLGSIK